MEAMWQMWKRGFDAWEQSTAKLFEQWLKSPVVLEPAGAMLTAAMKVKRQTDDAMAQWWAATGLPTRREQERMLHLINQLTSRVMDLEEELVDAREAAERREASARHEGEGGS